MAAGRTAVADLVSVGDPQRTTSKDSGNTGVFAFLHVRAESAAENAASRDDGVMDDDLEWLLRSIVLATGNVALNGGPFGAVVVRDGHVVGEGTNRVTVTCDPTAHAEIQAIRDACTRLSDFRLTGTTLYASCEPCPMCLSAMLWARIDRVVFAADRYAAESAGFDDAVFHGLLRVTEGAWPLAVSHRPIPEATRPFDAWQAFSERISY